MRTNLLALPLSTAAMLSCLSVVAKDSRPNILFLMTDDQAYHSIAALGNKQVKTPNIDRLVERGVLFTNHYAPTSISMASRAIVMTGMYEYKTGCNFMVGSMLREIFDKSYPMLLRESGYYTGFAGKFGFPVTDKPVETEEYMMECNRMSSREMLPSDTFDEWAGDIGQTTYTTKKNPYLQKYAEEYPHATRAYGAFGSDFIKNAAKQDKPFCLSISFKAPHGFIILDPMFEDVYKDTKFDNPRTLDFKADTLLPMQARLGRQYMVYSSLWYGTQEKRDDMNYKLNTLIHGADYAIGMLLEALEESGMTDNTIIIFTSDNGSALGAHNLGGKVLPYEASTKIPLIIVDPRNQKKAGSKIDEPTSMVDIAPTILEYAGIEKLNNIDGLSLTKLVEKRAAKLDRDNIPLMNVWGPPQCHALSIISGGMKYIYWGFNQNMDSVEELFDLDSDPEEIYNLATDQKYRRDLERMRTLYDERLAMWDKECVKYTYHKDFPTIFKRGISWEERKDLLPKACWDAFYQELEYIKYTGVKDDYPAIIEYVQSQIECK